jgi:hypothetical protein
LLALFRQAHVHLLNLSAGESLFESEVQADQGEDGADGFGLLVDMLGGISVDDVLVDEGFITETESIEG